MPVEIIGEAGRPGASLEWIDAEDQLATKHIPREYIEKFETALGE